MDDVLLIRLVRDYDEVYNTHNKVYVTHQRRLDIWNEIGKKLKKPGHACRERWLRIRDNYRKALKLRRTKTKTGDSKLRPPRYYKELTFVDPYLFDDEGSRSSNPDASTDSDVGIKEEIEEHSMPSISDTKSIKSGNDEFSNEREMSRSQSEDPLTSFFMSMARTVRTFPVTDQVEIKRALLQKVTDVELRLAAADDH